MTCQFGELDVIAYELADESRPSPVLVGRTTPVCPDNSLRKQLGRRFRFLALFETRP